LGSNNGWFSVTEASSILRPATGLVCVSGLAVEAKILRAAGLPVVISSGDRDQIAALVESSAVRAACLVSFGVAGGLAPELEPGTVIVSGEVVSEQRCWVVEPSHRRRVADFARSIGAIEGRVLGATSVLATREAKGFAWVSTRALAVDLESEIVATTAAALGIPFIVLRSIADPAHRDLPLASLVSLSARGKARVLPILSAVLQQPSQLAGMIGLAREVGKALAALIRPARALRGLAADA
jgi:hypothetical protein